MRGLLRGEEVGAVMVLNRDAWSTETIMPWGDYQGQTLDTIPAAYFATLREQKWLRTAWPGLSAYIEANWSTIEEQMEVAEDPFEHDEGFDSWDDYQRYGRTR